MAYPAAIVPKQDRRSAASAADQGLWSGYEPAAHTVRPKRHDGVKAAWLFFKHQCVRPDRHPGLARPRPDMRHRFQPACVVQCSTPDMGKFGIWACVPDAGRADRAEGNFSRCSGIGYARPVPQRSANLHIRTSHPKRFPEGTARGALTLRAMAPVIGDRRACDAVAHGAALAATVQRQGNLFGHRGNSLVVRSLQGYQSRPALRISNPVMRITNRPAMLANLLCRS